MPAFSDYNPIVVFIYFLTVAGLAMFIMNPVILGISLFGALICFRSRTRGKKDRSSGLFIGLFLLLALLNPLFHHNGATVLFLINDNPITLEALLYGFTSATMVVSVIYWFRSFSLLMTGDRLLYVFGKVSPKFSLMLSMSVRYIPLFATQARKIKASRKALGLWKEDNLWDAVKGGIRGFICLAGWSLENGIITVDSMEARGYGSGKRSFYSRYSFSLWDLGMLILILALTSVVIVSKAMGALDFGFYPRIGGELMTGAAAGAYACYTVLVLLPLGQIIREAGYGREKERKNGNH